MFNSHVFADISFVFTNISHIFTNIVIQITLIENNANVSKNSFQKTMFESIVDVFKKQTISLIENCSMTNSKISITNLFAKEIQIFSKIKNENIIVSSNNETKKDFEFLHNILT